MSRRRLLRYAVLVFAAGCAGPPNIRKDEDIRVPDSLELKSALRRGDAASRTRAALAMGRIQSQAYLTPLQAALADADAGVRAQAAFALGQSRIDDDGPSPEGLSARLSALLSDPAAAVRAAAAEALGKTGGAGAEEKLTALLGDKDPLLRREAAAGLLRLQYLKRTPELSTAATRALAEGLQDPDAGTRWRCAYAFSRAPEPRALAALVRAAGDPEPYVRLFSLRSLSQLGKNAPAEPALGALADPEESVRVEALAVLKAAGRADLVSAKIAQDASSRVRAAAAAALAGPEGRLELLRRLAQDRSAFVRGQALLSLAKRLGDAAQDDLLADAGERSWWVRSKIYEAAAELPNRGRRILEHGLGDKDVRVRAAALESMGKRPGVDADLIVAAALNDPRSPLEILGAAADAAARRKTPALLAPLRAAYESSGAREFVEVRESIADAAAAIREALPTERTAGVDEAAAFLALLERDPAPSVRAKAAKALGRPVETASPPEPSPFLPAPPPAETTVTLSTEKGEIEIELATSEAPLHAASFVALAKKGFYAGTPWHRVVSNFVIQGGDPRGSGWGDAGYFLRDEINRLRFERGTVGMPKAGKDTGGCQLFITLAPAPHLDGRYTVFGKVKRGMDVADRLEPGDLILKATAK